MIQIKEQIAELQMPHLDHYVSTEDLEKYTNLTKRFWEARRISGDTPPYVCISKRAVRYRWGDVVDWLNKKKRRHTAELTDMTKGAIND